MRSYMDVIETIDLLRNDKYKEKNKVFLRKALLNSNGDILDVFRRIKEYIHDELKHGYPEIDNASQRNIIPTIFIHLFKDEDVKLTQDINDVENISDLMFKNLRNYLLELMLLNCYGDDFMGECSELESLQKNLKLDSYFILMSMSVDLIKDEKIQKEKYINLIENILNMTYILESKNRINYFSNHEIFNIFDVLESKSYFEDSMLTIMDKSIMNSEYKLFENGFMEALLRRDKIKILSTKDNNVFEGYFHEMLNKLFKKGMNGYSNPDYIYNFIPIFIEDLNCLKNKDPEVFKSLYEKIGVTQDGPVLEDGGIHFIDKTFDLIKQNNRDLSFIFEDPGFKKFALKVLQKVSINDIDKFIMQKGDMAHLIDSINYDDLDESNDLLNCLIVNPEFREYIIYGDIKRPNDFEDFLNRTKYNNEAEIKLFPNQQKNLYIMKFIVDREKVLDELINRVKLGPSRKKIMNISIKKKIPYRMK